MFESKYGVARHIRIPVPKAGSANHAVGADWTPAAGDVKISKDGGAAANVTNLPTAIAMGNSAIWDFSLTATEMEAAQVVVTVADSATKAVDDTGFEIETYGHASAQHAFDRGTASVAQTGDSYAVVNSGTYGNSALKTILDTTGVKLTAAAVQSIWDALTSALTTVGSIGKWIVDKLDVVLSTRAATGAAMTLTSGERTSIANEVEAQIIDDTDSEKVLQAITDKIASVNPSLSGLTLAAIASQVRTNLATELGRIDDSISSRLAAAGYTAPSNSDIAAIKDQTDKLTFDGDDVLSTNVVKVNDITVGGSGTELDPWGPA